MTESPEGFVKGQAAFAALFIALLSACAGPGVRPTSSAGTEARIANVPFFPDGTDQCGPSTLASLLTFWNKPTTPQELRSEIYLRKVRGTLPMDLLPAVEARGLAGTVSEGSLEDLKSHLREGRPVLAYLDLGYSFLPQGHYVVVTGFDDRGVYAHSGKKKDAFFAYRKFDKNWKKTDRWMLVVDGRGENS